MRIRGNILERRDPIFLESDKSETDERYKRKHPSLYKMLDSQKILDDDDPIGTDIDLETNVTKKIELSTSALMARQLTENLDDMVDE